MGLSADRNLTTPPGLVMEVYRLLNDEIPPPPHLLGCVLRIITLEVEVDAHKFFSLEGVVSLSSVER